MNINPYRILTGTLSVLLLWSAVACATQPVLPTATPPPPPLATPTGAASTATPQPVAPPAALTATLLPSPGAASSPLPKPAKVEPGEYAESMLSGGINREYILHVPKSYDGTKPMPLVVALHGYGGSDKAMEETTGMDAAAEKYNFVVAYPNGTGDPRGWSAGFFPRPGEPDDVAFFRALLDNLERRLAVDSKRIYVVGFSNGAFMTYRLGAELSNTLAAISVAEGTIGTKQADGSIQTIPNPQGPVPLIAFHGKDDRTVPYNGGLSVGIEHLTFLSVADSMAFWLKNDGCSSSDQTKSLENGNVVISDYAECTPGAEVVLYTIGNGQHDWPNTRLANQISATEATWDFFSRHARP